MRRRKAYPTIRAFLDETGMKQFELAKRVGIGEGHLSMIVKGERTPRLPLALKIARIVNVPVETLVGKMHTQDVA